MIQPAAPTAPTWRGVSIVLKGIGTAKSSIASPTQLTSFPYAHNPLRIGARAVGVISQMGGYGGLHRRYRRA